MFKMPENRKTNHLTGSTWYDICNGRHVDSQYHKGRISWCYRTLDRGENGATGDLGDALRGHRVSTSVGRSQWGEYSPILCGCLRLDWDNEWGEIKGKKFTDYLIID